MYVLLCLCLVAIKIHDHNKYEVVVNEFWIYFQVQTATPWTVRGAAIGVFTEWRAAAGQAAMSVSQHGSRLLVWPGLSADQAAHRHLGGAEEDCMGRAWHVVKPDYTKIIKKRTYVFSTGPFSFRFYCRRRIFVNIDMSLYLWYLKNNVCRAVSQDTQFRFLHCVTSVHEAFKEKTVVGCLIKMFCNDSYALYLLFKR